MGKGVDANPDYSEIENLEKCDNNCKDKRNRVIYSSKDNLSHSKDKSKKSHKKDRKKKESKSKRDDNHKHSERNEKVENETNVESLKKPIKVEMNGMENPSEGKLNTKLSNKQPVIKELKKEHSNKSDVVERVENERSVSKDSIKRKRRFSNSQERKSRRSKSNERKKKKSKSDKDAETNNKVPKEHKRARSKDRRETKGSRNEEKRVNKRSNNGNLSEESFHKQNFNENVIKKEKSQGRSDITNGGCKNIIKDEQYSKIGNENRKSSSKGDRKHKEESNKKHSNGEKYDEVGKMYDLMENEKRRESKSKLSKEFDRQTNMEQKEDLRHGSKDHADFKKLSDKDCKGYKELTRDKKKKSNDAEESCRSVIKSGERKPNNDEYNKSSLENKDEKTLSKDSKKCENAVLNGEKQCNLNEKKSGRTSSSKEKKEHKLRSSKSANESNSKEHKKDKTSSKKNHTENKSSHDEHNQSSNKNFLQSKSSNRKDSKDRKLYTKEDKNIDKSKMKAIEQRNSIDKSKYSEELRNKDGKKSEVIKARCSTSSERGEIEQPKLKSSREDKRRNADKNSALSRNQDEEAHKRLITKDREERKRSHSKERKRRSCNNKNTGLREIPLNEKKEIECRIDKSALSKSDASDNKKSASSELEIKFKNDLISQGDKLTEEDVKAIDDKLNTSLNNTESNNRNCELSGIIGGTSVSTCNQESNTEACEREQLCSKERNELKKLNSEIKGERGRSLQRSDTDRTSSSGEKLVREHFRCKSRQISVSRGRKRNKRSRSKNRKYRRHQKSRDRKRSRSRSRKGRRRSSSRDRKRRASTSSSSCSRSFSGSSRSKSSESRSYSESSSSYSRSSSSYTSSSRSFSSSKSNCRSKSSSIRGVWKDSSPEKEECFKTSTFVSEFLNSSSIANQTTPSNIIANSQVKLAHLITNLGLDQSAAKAAKELYVGNLPPGIDVNQLLEFLNAAMITLGANIAPGNPCLKAWISADGHYAFIELRTIEEAANGMQLNELNCMGYTLRIGRPKTYPQELIPLAPAPTVVALDSAYLSQGIQGIQIGLEAEAQKAAEIPIDPAAALAAAQMAAMAVSSGTPANQISTNLKEPDRLCISNLPVDLPEDKVKELVSTFGSLKFFQLLRQENSASTGMCICTFQDFDTQLQAIELLSKNTTYQVIKTDEATPNFPVDLLRYQFQSFASISTPQIPSRVVMLCNLVTRQELEDDNEYDDIVEDVRLECANYGTLISVKIPRPLRGYPEDFESNTGYAFVEYSDLNGSAKARKMLSGRKFAGRVVEAHYFSESKYKRSDFKNPIPNYESESMDFEHKDDFENSASNMDDSDSSSGSSSSGSDEENEEKNVEK